MRHFWCCKSHLLYVFFLYFDLKEEKDRRQYRNTLQVLLDLVGASVEIFQSCTETVTSMFRDSIHEARRQLDSALPDYSPHTHTHTLGQKAQIMSRVCPWLLKRRETGRVGPAGKQSSRSGFSQPWHHAVLCSSMCLQSQQVFPPPFRPKTSREGEFAPHGQSCRTVFNEC